MAKEVMPHFREKVKATFTDQPVETLLLQMPCNGIYSIKSSDVH
jgi:hypothetical protein